MDKTVAFIVFLFLIFMVADESVADPLYDAVQKGNKLYRAGKFDEALKTYIDGQIENADDVNLRYNIASTHYKMKNYEEAVNGYLDVAATAPDEMLQEKALYGCGNALFRQGKLEQAIEYYQKALDLDPQDHDAQHNLEFAREELKRRINEAKDTEKKQQEQKQKQDQEQQKQNQQKDQQKNQDLQQDRNKQQEKKQQQQEQQEASRQEQKEQQSQAGEQKPEEQPQTQGQLSSAKNKRGDKAEDGQVLPQQVRPMTKEEADQWLSSIEEHRDKFAKKKTQEGIAGQYRPDKDW